MNADSRAAERGRRMSAKRSIEVQALLLRRLSPGELIRDGPRRLADLLRGDDFASYRVDLTALRRADARRFTDQYLTLLERLGQMTEEQDQIEVIPTIDYIAAKRFLGSLTIEARAPIEPVARIGMNTRTTR